MEAKRMRRPMDERADADTISRRELLGGSFRGVGGVALGAIAWGGIAPFLTGCALSPSTGKQLVVAQSADIVTLDPPMHRSRETQNVHQLIYDSLIHRSNDLKLIGRLAESWEVVDSQTYRFKMRAGAKFQDGKPVTSRDVKFSYDRTLDPALKAPRAGLLDMVASTEAPDDATVIVKTKYPEPLTPIYLTYHAILPMDDVKAQGEAFFQKPVGAGPFSFVEWKKGQQVVLKANPTYWGGKPLVDTLIIRAIPEPATMVAELESGGVDIVPNLPPSSYGQVKGNPKLQILTAPSTLINFVGLNTKKKPLDQVAVRQALNYAVDKQAIISSVLEGLAVPLPGPYFPEMRGYDPSIKGYPHDPARAKELLRGAGLADGFNVTMDAVEATKEVAEALAGQLAQVGVRAKVLVNDSGALTTKVQGGNSEMFVSAWGDSTADAGATLYRMFSSNQEKVFKDTGYSRPDLDKLIEQGRAAMDLNQRQTVFAQAEKIIVDDAPWIFLWQPKTVAATSTAVKGFTPRPDAYLFLAKVTKT